MEYTIVYNKNKVLSNLPESIIADNVTIIDNQAIFQNYTGNKTSTVCILNMDIVNSIHIEGQVLKKTYIYN